MKNVEPSVFRAANFLVWSTSTGISIIAVVKQNAAAIMHKKNAAMRWKRFSPHGLESTVGALSDEEKLIQLPIRLMNAIKPIFLIPTKKPVSVRWQLSILYRRFVS